MFKNNEKGITLVVLIITVVVLLILSGVTISMIVTDNGIINKTQKAKQNVEDVTTDTQTRLNELYSQGTYIDEIYSSIEDLEDISYEYEEFRRAIAESIGQAGGESPDYTAAASVFREKINGIVTEVTKDATATAADIAEGKTAWVNGEMITGTAEIPTQFQTMEFTMGSGTNNGGASGYRSFISFDSNWFIENVQKIEVKNCNMSSNVEIRAARYRTSASNNATSTRIGILKTTADYQEIDISRDFDTTTYPYIFIINNTSDSTNTAAACIKLVF